MCTDAAIPVFPSENESSGRPGCVRGVAAAGAEPIPNPGALMSAPAVRLHRWDEIALEKVTEMISRKIVTGERMMCTQIYLKKGALVPTHSHESEQMTYVLQGA